VDAAACDLYPLRAVHEGAVSPQDIFLTSRLPTPAEIKPAINKLNANVPKVAGTNTPGVVVEKEEQCDFG
jgi:hypothetical protein